MEGAYDLGTGVIARAHARVGLVLRDKWRLDHVIGVGGMAAVYAATHRNGSRAAIKMLHLEHCVDADTHRRFLREGYMANTVGHPGTVRVLDDDVCEDGSVFIVMELLEGETLETLAGRRGNKIGLAELLPIADDLLDILAAAHDKGVIHRDVKPENIFITSDGTVKLLDFGIARLRTVQPGGAVTVGNTTLGTPAFMSPEQTLGRSAELSAQSDLWSVGAVMFSLLAGRYVHVTESLTEQLVAHATRPPTSLASVAPDMPLPVVTLVDRALAFQKDWRWPSARAMQQAIREAQAALSGAEAPASSRSPASLSNPTPGAAIGHAPALTANPSNPSSSAIALVGTSPELTAPPGRGSQRLLLIFGIVSAAIVLTIGLFVLRLSATAENSLEPPLTAPPATASMNATAESVRAPEPVAAPLPESSVTASSAPTTESSSASPTSKRPPSQRSPRHPAASSTAAARPPDDDWLNRQH